MSIEHNREREQELLAELEGMVTQALSGDDAPEVYGQMAEFMDELSKRHPNLHEYRLYHVLARSGLEAGHEPKWDLPGGEIEQFIRSLKKQA